jgi:hypothetical protein
MPSYLVQGRSFHIAVGRRGVIRRDSRLALKRDRQRQGAEQVLRLRGDALIRQY